MNGHTVYFYEDDTLLIDNVAQFVKSGLEQQEAVIVVATEEHRNDLKMKLVAENVIGLSAPRGRNYLPLDAATMLSLFMLNGWPDERLFLKVIGQIIKSVTPPAPVRIYGEMVALLWAEGRHRAAIRLEALWNKLGVQRDFTLLCGYPASPFTRPDMAVAFQDVCAVTLK
jgi:DcmR-like sensory protein